MVGQLPERPKGTHVFRANSRRAWKRFLDRGKNLHTLDRVDSQIRVERHVRLERLFRIAGLLRNNTGQNLERARIYRSRNNRNSDLNRLGRGNRERSGCHWNGNGLWGHNNRNDGRNRCRWNRGRSNLDNRGRLVSDLGSHDWCYRKGCGATTQLRFDKRLECALGKFLTLKELTVQSRGLFLKLLKSRKRLAAKSQGAR